MGNNHGASSLLYSAPSPDPSTPPLSSDKYFWITSSATSAAATADNNGGGVSISSRRDIPVVYISSREERSNSSSDDDDGDGDDAVNESRSDENDRRHSSSSSSSFNSKKSGGCYRRYTILYCHGHDVDLASMYNHLCTLSTLLNVDVMSFEHEGFGLSLKSRSNTLTTTPATPTTVKKAEQPLSLEEQCRADIQTCYHYLIRNRHIPPSNIILYGKSAGSGPVCWLADSLYQKKKKKAVVAMTTAKTKSKESSSRKGWKSPPLGGIVLHSAFLSHPRGGDVGLSTCSSDYINLPVYLIHGTMDNVIPIQHSITLYNQFVMQHRRRSFPPFWADGTYFLYYYCM